MRQDTWHDERNEGWELIPRTADSDRALRRINRNIIRVGRTLERMEENMANIAEVQAAVGRIEGNTANVERALGVLNDTNAALVQQVADLQAVIEGGGAVTAEQLQELQDRLTAADAAMDAIAPEAPNDPNVPA